MKTYHIHINGIVQGVGFRPLVYKQATEMRLNGFVKNSNDGVHVYFNATKETADLFYNRLIQFAPEQAKIISSSLRETATQSFGKFSILVEGDDYKKNVLVAPDKALCKKCKHEIHNTHNRRYRYPFTTCTHCGPRYSIITGLPYERPDTAMRKFLMCENCYHEYNDVDNRRFFSQTNSCKDCGIKLSMHDSATRLSDNTEEVLSEIKKNLSKGKIIAMKGIGGYLLLCDANKEETIELLRSRKHRPAKPFAVLYPCKRQAHDHFLISRKEENLLESTEAPIVLLYPKHCAENNLQIKLIAPGLDRIGVMLPYNPLLEIVVSDYGKPLIATSANISGSPIIYEDDMALDYLFKIADFIVSHDREIISPQDDSVVQVTSQSKNKIILRRARGYAPLQLGYHPRTEKTLLATGALLKSSFTLAINDNVFVSQYLGTGDVYESQKMYKDTLWHCLNLYNATPEVIITDMHPNYFSHQYAGELAESFGASVKYVQHHEAHYAAVLAENNLLTSTEPVLGVIWDGNGFGADRNVWGGEFFIYNKRNMSRAHHLDYFPVIAGDKIAMEPRLAALCTTYNKSRLFENLKQKFTEVEWNNYQTLLTADGILSSSCGRLFDAVASILNLIDRQSYEGQAAMLLQGLAWQWVCKKGFHVASYFENDENMSTEDILVGIATDIKEGKAKSQIAARFHFSLVCLVDMVAKKTAVRKICFSGGVFQNPLLVDWIQFELKHKYQLCFQKQLSPNDENISFGQMVYYDNNINNIKGIQVEEKKVATQTKMRSTIEQFKPNA